MITLIDSLYDFAIKNYAQAEAYDFPLSFPNGSGYDEQIIRVWARNEEEAERRATKYAVCLLQKRREKNSDKYLGLVFNASDYKPKALVASPMVWRSPVYSRGIEKLFNPVGMKTGTLFKRSIQNLLESRKGNESSKELSFDSLVIIRRNCTVTLSVYLALTILGAMFCILGITKIEGLSVLKFFMSPYIAAGIVCSFIGVISTVSSIHDMKRIITLITEKQHTTVGEQRV